MPSIIDTLQQETMWYAQDGLPIPLVQMDPEHMVNLYHYLLRNADRLYEHKLWAELKRLKGDEVVLAMLQLPQDAERWIQTTPFFQALRRRMMNSQSINPDSLTIEGERSGQRREEGRREEPRRLSRRVFYLEGRKAGT